jgi:ribonuclease D
MARRYGAGLLEAVERGVADESPLPARPKKLRKSDRRSSSKDSPSMDRLLGPLRDWRNALVNDRNLSPVVVVSNQQLKEIARAAPANADELGGIPGIRKWQVRAYGDALLQIVAGVEAPARKRRRRRRKASTKPSPEG